MAVKLHVKHIIPGFLFCSKNKPSNHMIVTKICSYENGSGRDERTCEVFDFATNQYKLALRRGILEGIRKGNLISLNGEEYR